MKENYLEKHLEPRLPENGENISANEDFFVGCSENIKHLFNQDIKYEKNGKETFKLKEGWTLEYTYETLNKDDTDFLYKAEKDLYLTNRDEIYQNFRKLTNVYIKDQNGEGLDLVKDFDVHNIFFAIERPNINDTSKCYMGKIISYLPPNNFFAIVVILHEASHLAKLFDDIKNVNMDKFIKTIKRGIGERVINYPAFYHAILPDKWTNSLSEEVLKSERDASARTAFVLKNKLNAFGVSKEELLDVIHINGLRSYSDSIRVAIGKE